eukprot:12999925-Ditylum_brightwellii.AAC.2
MGQVKRYLAKTFESVAGGGHTTDWQTEKDHPQPILSSLQITKENKEALEARSAAIISEQYHSKTGARRYS